MAGRKEGRKSRGIVTTPARARAFFVPGLLFRRGVRKRDGTEDETAGGCSITPDFFFPQRRFSRLMLHLRDREEKSPRDFKLSRDRHFDRDRKTPSLLTTFPFRFASLPVPSLYAGLLAPIKRSDSLFSRPTRRRPPRGKRSALTK